MAKPAIDAIIAQAGSDDTAPISALHGRLFDPAWDTAAITGLTAPPAALALVARAPSSPPAFSQTQRGGRPLAGFLLARAAAGEAEILSIGVAPELRRQGLARRLLEAALPALRERGAQRLFLEVAADNAPALGLYRSAGLTEVGRRRAYYMRRGGPAADALLLARDL